MAKKVTVIQPYLNRETTQLVKKLRVCAYARVSTKNPDQATSYVAQVEYYTDKIMKNPLWEFAAIYADEGISGKKKQGRHEFEAMIHDCEEGLIDLILTKSISRFARNTLECIKIVRYLKEMGVGVYFEKENINTLEESSEFMLTLLASIAQAEAEDISSNVKWGIQKRFANGTFRVAMPAFGYVKDNVGELLIHEEKAEIIKFIFKSYINGNGCFRIAQELNSMGIAPRKKAPYWEEGAVREILKNYAYEGNSLFQKTYTETVYPFLRKINYGQLAMYLIEDSHQPIISHEDAEKVRRIMTYRQQQLHSKIQQENNVYVFTKKIICEECGKKLKRKIVNTGKPKERIVWVCKTHLNDKEKCGMVEIREEVLQNAFVNMWNKLYTNQGTLLEPLLNGLNELQSDKAGCEEIEKLNIELKKLNEQSQILSQVMMQGYMDPALFMEKNNQLMHEIQRCRKKKLKKVKKQKNEKEITRTEKLIEMIREGGYQTEFKDELFEQMVKEIRISINHEIRFCLINGLTLTELEGENMDGMALTAWL